MYFNEQKLMNISVESMSGVEDLYVMDHDESDLDAEGDLVDVANER